MDVERALGVCGRLHVDAHKRVQLARPFEDLAQVRYAHLARKIQSELGQLERDVAFDLLGAEGFERVLVGSDRASSGRGAGHTFPQVIEADEHPLRVQGAHDVYGIVERFSCHEPA